MCWRVFVVTFSSVKPSIRVPMLFWTSGTVFMTWRRCSKSFWETCLILCWPENCTPRLSAARVSNTMLRQSFLKEQFSQKIQSHSLSDHPRNIYNNTIKYNHTHSQTIRETSTIIQLNTITFTLRPSEIRMSLFLHQVWRNVSQCLSNGCSAVNGCRQNESLIKTSQ